MKININIAGKILTATLADNATARDCSSIRVSHTSGYRVQASTPKSTQTTILIWGKC